MIKVKNLGDRIEMKGNCGLNVNAVSSRTYKDEQNMLYTAWQIVSDVNNLYIDFVALDNHVTSCALFEDEIRS
jgi:hypothetical protein